MTALLAVPTRAFASEQIALEWNALGTALAVRRVEVKTTSGKRLKGLIVIGDGTAGAKVAGLVRFGFGADAIIECHVHL